MVEFIEYKEKKYPLKVGYYGLMMAQQETGKSVNSEADLDFSNFDFFCTVLYYSLELGHEMTKRKLTLKRSEMRLMLNECFPAFMKVFYNFTLSMNKDTDLTPVEEEKSKKK